MPATTTPGFFQLAHQLREFAKEQLPIVEKQVNDLIARKEKDSEIIECLLLITATLVEMGAGIALYDRLHEYYRSVKQAEKR